MKLCHFSHNRMITDYKNSRFIFTGTRCTCLSTVIAWSVMSLLNYIALFQGFTPLDFAMCRSPLPSSPPHSVEIWSCISQLYQIQYRCDNFASLSILKRLNIPHFCIPRCHVILCVSSNLQVYGMWEEARVTTKTQAELHTERPANPINDLHGRSQCTIVAQHLSNLKKNK